MSASLVVDLGNTTLHQVTIVPEYQPVASGAVVGRGVDMLHADTLTNVFIAHGNILSGRADYAFQESDTDVSGNYAAINVNSGESWWMSGGRTTINSSGVGMSGTGRVSGAIPMGFFQRQRRYVRAIQEALGAIGSDAEVGVGVVAQLLQTGSGGGFTLAPSSGTVNV